MGEKSSIDSDVLPAPLREREQWVGWRGKERDGKQTKVPINPETGDFGSATDSATWADIETAMAAVENGTADGVGFVFTDDDPLVGVDVDDCRDPETGDVDADAKDIIERLDSYTEVSPSGTGYHVLLKGDLPEGRNRRGSVECYDTARFFTVTGNHIPSTPGRIARRQDALQGIHRDYVQPNDEDESTENTELTKTSAAATAPSDVDLDDKELLKKAKAAANGEKFKRLWNGQTVGYESQSEADMALCCLLAFWTGGDQARVDWLFRESGLLREKWDEVHYADGSTYGEKTVKRAVAQTSEFYEPDAGEKSTRESDTPDDGRGNAAQSGTKRSRTYLREKNQLLADRVDELEDTLEEKNNRIEALEAQVEQSEAKLAARDNSTDSTSRKQGVDADKSKAKSETASLLDRTKQLFGTDSD